MDVQTDIRHVVQMFAGNKPDDLADRSFGIMTGHASKGVGINPLVFGQFCYVIQCRALGIGKKRACAVLLQRIEFGLVHRRLDRERPADIHAEKADIDPRHLFPNEQGSLGRQLQLLIEFADLRIEQTERQAATARNAPLAESALCQIAGV